MLATHRLIGTRTALATLTAQSLRRFATASAASTSSSEPYDVVVIGGGPGGYVAAIKSAQLGLRTACIESRGTLGGTCLNVGCIPSKALLNASHHYKDTKQYFPRIGIDIAESKLNLSNLMAYKTRAVKGLTGGIEHLFKKNKVDYFKARGSFVDKTTLKATAIDGGGEQTIKAKHIVIATGSEPAPLKGVNVDEKFIVTSTGALSLEKVPKHLVVIGGGVIGLEMGSVWLRFGSQVTVVEYLDRIIPGTDSEVAANFKKILEKQGMKFRMGTKVTNAEKKGDNVILTVEPAKGGKAETIEGDIVLLATGRLPYTESLGLDKIGLSLNKKRQIETDEHFRTSVDNVFAIGDVIPGPMLAHKAEEEGIAVAEIIAGKAGHVNYGAIPGVIYTHPEVAWVGMSEDDCKAKNIAVRITKFPFAGNSRTKTNDDAEGSVKVISDSETDRLLGMYIVGPLAGELIAEATLAIEYGASAEDIARTSHAHPTLSEAVKEACMEKPIHF